MIYMFLAEGFEEVEAIAPLDLIRRSGLEIKTVGIGSKVIVGSHGIPVVADMIEEELSDDAPDMVILPGGMPGTKNLDANATVHKAIADAVKNDAYVCAICAAPMILGKLGLLRDKNAVSYPGFEEYLDGATLPDKKVVRDGKIITAKGMGAGLEFGLEIIAALKGSECADKLAETAIIK
jgi:4-methyl-5(b-hydroxyethyl)-thiazole monophosphate biosynthesis